MAVTISGLAARAIGVLAGLVSLGGGLLLWAVMGVVSTNVPFPAERAVESMLPLSGPMLEQPLPLAVLLPGAAFAGVFFLYGLAGVLGALLKPDYAVNLSITGPDRGGGGV